MSKPSVFWTQFVPKGAEVAVALQRMVSKVMSVPFMMLRDQRGGSLTKKDCTVTVLTFQKTKGIGRPGWVVLGVVSEPFWVFGDGGGFKGLTHAQRCTMHCHCH